RSATGARRGPRPIPGGGRARGRRALDRMGRLRSDFESRSRREPGACTPPRERGPHTEAVPPQSGGGPHPGEAAGTPVHTGNGRGLGPTRRRGPGARGRNEAGPLVAVTTRLPALPSADSFSRLEPWLTQGMATAHDVS